MVSLQIHLLATFFLISEAFSQFSGCGCGAPTRYASPTAPSSSSGSIIPCGKFIVPAMIKPLLPMNQPSACAQPSLSTANKQTPVTPKYPATCADDDELETLLCLLVKNILENKKTSGKKQSSPSIVNDNCASISAGVSDAYDGYSGGYGDDYDYGGLPSAYSTPVIYSSGNDAAYASPSGDDSCPEICVYLRPYCTD